MNIKIRPLAEADAHTSVKWRNIPQLWVYTEFKADHKITLEDELNWIRKVIADPTSQRFAIIVDGKYVGNIYLTDIENGTGEYHIFIGDQDYWGKGVAKEASRQLIEFAADKVKLKQVNLRVKKDNIAAYALYEKLGFKKTGIKDGFITMSLSLANR